MVDPALSCTIAVCIVVAIVGLRLMYLWVLHRSRFNVTSKESVRPKEGKPRTLIILGSGGHTGEMLALLEKFQHLYRWDITFVIAETDRQSYAQLKSASFSLSCASDAEQLRYDITYIPRSREVGQSYVSSIVSTLRAAFSCVGLLCRVQPNLIFCNGPGTCVPVCLVARILEMLGLLGSPLRIMYIESICRVQQLSVTGRILYFLCDECLVQWSSLAQRYPKARYCGILY